MLNAQAVAEVASLAALEAEDASGKKRLGKCCNYSVLLGNPVGAVFASSNKRVQDGDGISYRFGLTVYNCREMKTAMAMIPRRQVYMCQRVACPSQTLSI